MTISVIIPVYNTEQYLCECIDSVIAQTHTVDEIILVDDGSTDSSGDICDRYASDYTNIKVIHKPNGGQSSARNAGIDIATGEYLMFIDSDDLIHPECVATLKANINNGDMAVCRFTYGSVCHWSNKTYTVKTFDTIEGIKRTLYQNKLDSSMCGRLIPADVFKNERFTPNLYYEDLDICYRIIEQLTGKVVYIDHDLYFYRNNPKSFINTFNKKRLDVLKITDMIEARYNGHSVLHKAAKDRKFSANCNMFILTTQAGMTDIAASCWKVIKEYRLSEILNPEVRLKNKLGALISYLGKRAFIPASKYS